MAVQIGKYLGARVIATASTPKLHALEALEPDEIVDHATEDIRLRVGEITHRRGVDVVFEHVGKAVWDACLKSLSPGGRLVTCGATTGHEAMTDLRYVFQRQLKIMGDYMGSKGELLDAWKLVFEGRLRPIVDRTFDLAEAGRAQDEMDERRVRGKLVLTIS